MRNTLKAAASALGLFVMVTVGIDVSVKAKPDDMHWPTRAAVSVSVDAAVSG